MTRFSHSSFLKREKAAGRNPDRTSAPRCHNLSGCSAAARAEPVEPECGWFSSTRCRFRDVLLLGWMLFSPMDQPVLPDSLQSFSSCFRRHGPAGAEGHRVLPQRQEEQAGVERGADGDHQEGGSSWTQNLPDVLFW